MSGLPSWSGLAFSNTAFWLVLGNGKVWILFQLDVFSTFRQELFDDRIVCGDTRVDFQSDEQDCMYLKSKGKLEDDPVKKTNILNAQFQSVFSPRTPLSLKSLCHRAAGFIKRDGTACDTPKMPQINITEEGVRKGLERLNPHKAAGPDKIGPLVLKELAEVIVPVITRIFRASLSQGK